ncbi:MAG TPA: type II toxin-antitoxin system VapC family toxin [Acidobacteriaceae bacterium]|jgi:hypothetical protein|nr:type II toxin-antitoxin system VapC family toxin [Acidobacteriaceae bacterium]
MIVVDTNVLSEAMRERPDPAVAAWLQGQTALEAFTTAISKAEILYGIEILPQGRKRAALSRVADLIFFETLAGRVLGFDEAAAPHYAQIAAARKASGRAVKTADAQIAAIVRLHGATLATGNTRDFEGCGIRVVNPWGR